MLWNIARKGKTYGEGGGNYCDRVCLMLFASDHYIVLLTVFVWDTAIGFSCEIADYWVITLFQAYANCTVNTCICYAFIGKYRQDLKALFGCHFKRKYLLRQTKGFLSYNLLTDLSNNIQKHIEEQSAITIISKPRTKHSASTTPL